MHLTALTLEVNEPKALMIINQYTISVGLDGVRKKQNKTAHKSSRRKMERREGVK